MHGATLRARAMSGDGDELLEEVCCAATMLCSPYPWLQCNRGAAAGGLVVVPQTRISNFLPTARRIVQFADGRAPKPTDKVVYTAGSWDLFHAGHMSVGLHVMRLVVWAGR